MHAVGAPYCPFAPQVRTELPLHALVDGVHAQQLPEPLHVPPLHAVPCATEVVPQVLPVQVATRQEVGGVGQSATDVQPTHVPVAGSQTGVAPEQGVCGAY